MLITLNDGNKSKASGFYLRNTKNEIFLITAGHVLYKKEKENNNSKNVLKSRKVTLLSQPFPLNSEEQIEIELNLDVLNENENIMTNFSRDVIASFAIFLLHAAWNIVATIETGILAIILF